MECFLSPGFLSVIMGMGVLLGCCLSRCWARLNQVRTSDKDIQSAPIRLEKAYWNEPLDGVRHEGLRRRIAGADAMSRRDLARVLLEQDLNEL